MHHRGAARGAGCWVLLCLLCANCASLSEERDGVRFIAERHLDCPVDRVVARLDDESTSVRHWIASCDYQGVRITCSRDGCSDEVEWLHLNCEMPAEMVHRADGGPSAALAPLSACGLPFAAMQ